MKFVNALMAVLFLIAAGLQHNDPDPVRWMVVYFAGVAGCAQHMRHERSWLVSGVIAMASLAWAVALIVTANRLVSIGELFQPMQTYGGAVEIGREIVGLLIVAVWMLALSVHARRRESSVRK